MADDPLLASPITRQIDLPGWASAAHVAAVFDTFARAGAEARFVGGCVRDAVLGLTPSDIDLATPVEPTGVIELLEAAGIKAIPTGIEHGTVTAVVDGGHVEITTLRRDVDTDGRHAEVAFSQSWSEDAARRDFTINALNATQAGLVEDWTNGLEDLEAGRVRFIGDAGQRITEDYLRILRFFRFHGRFAKGAPDVAAMEACIANAAAIPKLSGERIRDEILKILGQPAGPSLTALMAGTGILGHTLPVELSAENLAAAHGHRAFPVRDGLLSLSVALPETVEVREQIASHLRLSNDQRKRLITVLQPMPDNQALAMHRLGKQAVSDRAWLDYAAGPLDDAGLTALLQQIEAWAPVQLPIGGQDLQAIGLAPGPQMGEVLRAVEAWWFDGDCQADRVATLAEAKRLIQAID